MQKKQINFDRYNAQSFCKISFFGHNDLEDFKVVRDNVC